MKLAPDRKKFMEVISGSGDINADMEKFCTTFAPLLAENHKFLVRTLRSIASVAGARVNVHRGRNLFALTAGERGSR